MNEERLRRFVVVVSPDEEDGGYVAYVPSLPGVVDQGETREEAYENVKASLQFALESMAEAGEELPAPEETAREIELSF